MLTPALTAGTVAVILLAIFWHRRSASTLKEPEAAREVVNQIDGFHIDFMLYITLPTQHAAITLDARAMRGSVFDLHITLSHIGEGLSSDWVCVCLKLKELSVLEATHPGTRMTESGKMVFPHLERGKTYTLLASLSPPPSSGRKVDNQGDRVF